MMERTAKKSARKGAHDHLMEAVGAWRLGADYDELVNDCGAWAGRVREAAREAEKAEFRAAAERPRGQLEVLGHIKARGPRLEEWLARPVLQPVDYLRLRLRSGVNGLEASKRQRGYEGSDGKCACGEEETTEHFLLNCRHYSEQRKRLLEQLKTTSGGARFAKLQQPSEKMAFLLAGKGGDLVDSIGEVKEELSNLLADHLAALWKAACAVVGTTISGSRIPRVDWA